MNKLSPSLLSETVLLLRKSKGISQAELAEAADMNRSMLSRLEQQKYIPSIDQLQKLGEILGFEPASLFVPDPKPVIVDRTYKIAVAGTGYVGLSLAVLLAQHQGDLNQHISGYKNIQAAIILFSVPVSYLSYNVNHYLHPWKRKLYYDMPSELLLSIVIPQYMWLFFIPQVTGPLDFKLP